VVLRDGCGSHRSEMGLHQAPELRHSHVAMLPLVLAAGAGPGGRYRRRHARHRRHGAVISPATLPLTTLSALAADPTGLSSPIGRLVILAGLISALVLLIWQWRRRR